jgi:hypothetical protein
VVEALCRTPLAGGEGWEIHVWRTAKNETTILELRKHASEPAPRSYADAAGRSLLTLPAKGAPRHLEELRALLLTGLKESEALRCGNGGK